MWPNPQFSANLITFTEEIVNGKLHLLFCGKFAMSQWVHTKTWKILTFLLLLFLSYLVIINGMHSLFLPTITLFRIWLKFPNMEITVCLTPKTLSLGRKSNFVSIKIIVIGTVPWHNKICIIFREEIL